jgi:hypothetical protein
MHVMKKMLGLRVVALLLITLGVIAGVQTLWGLARPSFVNAAFWLMVCVACLKAGVIWLKETEGAWRQFRWDQAKARWRKREPDWWWLARYPLHITVSSFDPSFVHPDGTIERLYCRPPATGGQFEQFKRDLSRQGYGPDKQDPCLDGGIDRWLKRYYEKASDPRVKDFR